MPTLHPNPTLVDIQAYVTKLEQERGFTDHSVLQQCLQLGEEIGELFKAVRKSHAQIGYATPEYEPNAAEEIADILIMLCAIANRLDVNIKTALKDKEAINHKRTWE